MYCADTVAIPGREETRDSGDKDGVQVCLPAGRAVQQGSGLCPGFLLLLVMLKGNANHSYCCPISASVNISDFTTVQHLTWSFSQSVNKLFAQLVRLKAKQGQEYFQRSSVYVVTSVSCNISEL